jgi:hypothetical protein
LVSDWGSTPPEPQKDADAAVQHLQGAIHLDGEVDVARGVNDVELTIFPEAGGGGGLNGDPPLLLLFHKVGGGRPFVHLADFVDLRPVSFKIRSVVVVLPASTWAKMPILR